MNIQITKKYLLSSLALFLLPSLAMSEKVIFSKHNCRAHSSDTSYLCQVEGVKYEELAQYVNTGIGYIDSVQKANTFEYIYYCDQPQAVQTEVSINNVSFTLTSSRTPDIRTSQAVPIFSISDNYTFMTNIPSPLFTIKNDCVLKIISNTTNAHVTPITIQKWQAEKSDLEQQKKDAELSRDGFETLAVMKPAFDLIEYISNNMTVNIDNRSEMLTLLGDITNWRRQDENGNDVNVNLLTYIAFYDADFSMEEKQLFMKLNNYFFNQPDPSPIVFDNILSDEEKQVIRNLVEQSEAVHNAQGSYEYFDRKVSDLEVAIAELTNLLDKY